MGVVVHPQGDHAGEVGAEATPPAATSVVKSRRSSDGDRVRVRVGQLTAEITAAAARRLRLAPGEVVVASFKATGARLVPLAEAD